MATWQLVRSCALGTYHRPQSPFSPSCLGGSDQQAVWRYCAIKTTACVHFDEMSKQRRLRFLVASTEQLRVDVVVAPNRSRSGIRLPPMRVNLRSSRSGSCRSVGG